MTSSRSFFSQIITILILIYIDFVRSQEECGPDYIIEESRNAQIATTLLGALNKMRSGSKTLPLNESISFECIKP